jgi:hypothetical protein
MEHWFIMNGESRITPDDSLNSEEKSQDFDLYEIKKPMLYKDGLTRYNEIKGVSNQAEPFEDEIAF